MGLSETGYIIKSRPTNQASRASALVLCVLLCALLGCDSCVETSYTKLDLPAKNPTWFIFPTGVNDVVAAARAATNEMHSGFGGRLASFVTREDELWEVEMKENWLPKNPLDCFIYRTEPESSQVYYNPREPIWYYANYLVHVVPIATDTTLVEIRALNPRIALGEKLFWRLIPDSWGHSSLILKEVPPTTVEEYEILLLIGKQLDMEEKMPRIIRPIPPDP